MIKHFGNITLFGGSHIASESVSVLDSLFDSHKFDVVALELDSPRFQSLLARIDNIPVKRSHYSPFEIGFQGFLFAKVASFIQNKLAFRLGVKPGVEMEEAVKLARVSGSRIALVDAPISDTMRRFSSEVPLSEKARLFIDPVLSIFHRKDARTFDLSSVPSEDLVDEVILFMRNRYPHLFDVLVDSRNRFIASKLFEFYRSNENVLAVLGAGHIRGVLEYLHQFEREQASLPQYNFSFSVSFKN